MDVKHNFVDLAEVQKKSGTLYCGGLDPHGFGFGSFEESACVYGLVEKGEVYDLYLDLIGNTSISAVDFNNRSKFAGLLAGIEGYICRRVVRPLVEDCFVRVFKPQFGLYVQFGPVGLFLLQRINQFIIELEKTAGRIIRLLDCKVGDISTTQEGYFAGLIGGLFSKWGIRYNPFDFDIINITPWMGLDVCLLKDKGAGFEQMAYEGKGLIVVNKSSNPSGPMYQEVYKDEKGTTLQMGNVRDVYQLSCEAGLEFDGLSALGLVVGSTHPCDGSIRKAFPTTTMLVPGFGAQGGVFKNIMPELITDGKWRGQGAIFSASRSTMFAFMQKYGGSGNSRNQEKDLIESIRRFREQEKAAYRGSGILCPFD